MKNTNRLSHLLLLFFVLLITLGSCKSPSVILPTTTQTTSDKLVKEVFRDTVFEIKKDNSFYNAWLECQNGKVTIKDAPKVIKGQYLQPPKVIVKDNYITVDCQAEAQKLFAKWKDSYTIENKQTTINTVIEAERKLNLWQTFQIWCGRIFLILTIYTATRFLLKIYKPI